MTKKLAFKISKTYQSLELDINFKNERFDADFKDVQIGQEVVENQCRYTVTNTHCFYSDNHGAKYLLVRIFKK